MDARDRAYATLGLPRDCSLEEVRGQFKRLARRWHPDRFANDPQGQAEAAQRMREINAAYKAIRSEEESSPAAPPASAPTVPLHAEPRERVTQPLGRDAIEGIVKSIGRESPIDVLLAFLAWSWPLFLALLINPPRYQWLKDELAERPHSSVAGWQLLLVGLAVWLRFRQDQGRGDQ